MTLASVLGLDIGGANLKAAHTCGAASLRPYALWKNPGGLSEALGQLIRELPPYDCVAVTMTGELCDCFESKHQGVEAILAAAESISERRPVRVWSTSACFVDLHTARAEPLSVAAANWLALATFLGRLVPEGPALVLDIGSTTTDLVPLRDGKPVPCGRSDPERLHCGELVYTGVRRTPVCALLGSEGAAELFATIQDVYLVLGDLPEESDNRDTADGRPTTQAAAHARLARMLCADRETCSEEQTRKLALRIHSRQLVLLRRAAKRVSAYLGELPRSVLTAGSGEFLARKLFADRRRSAIRWISLAETLGPGVSQAACAYAVAILAAEECEHAKG
jgi:probable H4MPT-linked C1 transfer pathway protein